MTTADTPVDADALAAFADAFSGQVIRPTDGEYEAARRVWNGMIDRHPGLVVRPTGVADVAAAVTFARDHDLLVAIRGGGHNVAGSGTCDDGLVVDLSAMRSVRVDPDSGTVRAEAGATWADVDRETQVFGLVVPGGIVSTTGIAGLTLGGGFGHTRRKFGLTCDSLRSVDLVTADGEFRTASDDEHEELFWALRGGGGNFGVVTSFEYDCHELGPEVMATSVMYAMDHATDLLGAWCEFMADAPEEISSTAIFWTIPEHPAFPTAVHGTPVFVISAMYAGSVEEGQSALRPIRELEEPVFDPSGPARYTELQSRFDVFFPAGERRYYWKSRYLETLPDGALETVVACAEERPSPHSFVMLRNRGGAIARVPREETAVPDRTSPWMISVDAAWDDPDDDEVNATWARDCYERMRPYAADGVYLNFAMGDEGDDLVRTTFGEQYDRLVEVKRQYDPDNVFRVNLNVPPAAGVD
jgi:FAD/FMN-containing dehydrogenase